MRSAVTSVTGTRSRASGDFAMSTTATSADAGLPGPFGNRALARVDDRQFRLLKRGTPGGYTFLLTATREVPRRRLVHPRRRTIGIRVSDHPIALALLSELNEPLLSSTLIPQGEN